MKQQKQQTLLLHMDKLMHKWFYYILIESEIINKIK